MAVVPYSNTPCLDLQLIAEQIQNEQSYQMGQYDVQNFIRSSENRNNGLFKAVQLNQLIDTDGKALSSAERGKFKVYYREQKCEVDAFTPTSECSNLTAGTGEPKPKGIDFLTDKKFGFKVTIKHEEYKDVCYTADMAKERIFAAYEDQMLNQIEEWIIGAIGANIGKYHSQAGGVPNSGDTPVSANLINDNGTLNPAIVTLLKQAFRRKKIRNKIKFFGDVAGVVARGVSALQYTIANFNNGTDVTKIIAQSEWGISEALNIALDDAFPTAKGDHILGVPYGSYQLVEWFDYKNTYRVKFGEKGLPFEKSIMNVFGWDWDVHMERTKCDDIFEFKKLVGLFAQPKTACEDNLALNFLGACGASDCATMNALAIC